MMVAPVRTDTRIEARFGEGLTKESVSRLAIFLIKELDTLRTSTGHFDQPACTSSHESELCSGSEDYHLTE